MAFGPITLKCNRCDAVPALEYREQPGGHRAGTCRVRCRVCGRQTDPHRTEEYRGSLWRAKQAAMAQWNPMIEDER